MIEFEKEGNGNFCVILSYKLLEYNHLCIGFYGEQNIGCTGVGEVFFGRDGSIGCWLTDRVSGCKILSEEWV